MKDLTDAKVDNAETAGAILATSQRPRLLNSIIWANFDQANSPVQVLVLANSFRLPRIEYTCIQDEDPNDNTLPFGGAETGIIDDDPLPSLTIAGFGHHTRRDV